MTVTNVAWRLTIPLPGSTFVAGQDTDPASTDFWVTSLRDPTKHNYITKPPEIEGDFLDLTNGSVRDGLFRVYVSDVGTTAANRYLTSFLADVYGQMQLSGLLAYLDVSTDSGATWTAKTRGYVEGKVLPIAQEWAISCGNARRAERLAPLLHGFSQLDSSLTAFRQTPIIGGPVVGGFPPFLGDEGYPLATVLANFEDTNQLEECWVAFGNWTPPMPPKFLSRGPGGYGKTGPTVNTNPGPGFGNVAKEDENYLIAVNGMAAPFFVPGHPIVVNADAPNGTVYNRGSFGEVSAYLLDAATNAVQYGPFQVMAVAQAGSPVHGLTTATPYMIHDPSEDMFIRWPVAQIGDLDTEAPVGATFRVAVVPPGFSAEFPLHVLAHPVTAVAQAFEHIGLTIDTTTRDAVIAELGVDRLMVDRLTDPSMTTQAFAEMVGHRYGFAVTIKTNGSRGFVTTRGRWGTVATTVDDSVVIRPGGSPSFEIQEESRKNIARLTSDYLTTWAPHVGTRQHDDLVVFQGAIDAAYSSDGATDDSATYGERVIDIRATGVTGMAWNGLPPSILNPVTVTFQGHEWDAQAHHLLDRHGRGMKMFALPVREGSVTEDIGELVILDVDHLPNPQPGQSPVTQRGGTQLARIVQKRSQGIHEVITFASEGTGDVYAPAGGLDIDIAVAGEWPESHVEVSVTDGGPEMEADGAILDIYVGLTDDGFGPTTPDRGVLLFAADLRANALQGSYRVYMPLATAGLTWWVRAEAWIPGSRPSASTYWYSFNGPDTGGGVTPPSPPGPENGTISNLVLTTAGPDYLTVSWTTTNLVDPITARINLAGDATSLQVTLLPGGSSTYTFRGLTPSTSYDVLVILHEMPTFRTLVALSGTFATIAGSPTLVLQTPINPRVFAGYIPSIGLQQDGAVGMIVTPVLNGLVHSIEFQATPETSVGSGTPSGWPGEGSPDASSRRVLYAAGAGDVSDALVAVNDGRRWYWRARAYRSATEFSNWTAELSILPTFDGSMTPPQGPTGTAFDGGSPATTYTEFLDGGSPTTVFAEFVDGGVP